ncbi:HU family DNA-binding protein [Phaeovulum sp. W22_SRMD_FR3]|uniref:HU family DNA-binding protein n=1 Tax=Phaeovulum sp. W22_SRMD_FR3 TaxID=3240274 RepID=UPI003F9DA825
MASSTTDSPQDDQVIDGGVAAEGPEGTLMLKKKDFVDRVVKASGAKRGEAKGVIEATLQMLGDALASGESLVLPPLGRLKVSRQIDKAGGEIMVIKLKRGGEGGGKKTEELGLAEPAE